MLSWRNWTVNAMYHIRERISECVKLTSICPLQIRHSSAALCPKLNASAELAAPPLLLLLPNVKGLLLSNVKGGTAPKTECWCGAASCIATARPACTATEGEQWGSGRCTWTCMAAKLNLTVKLARVVIVICIMGYRRAPPMYRLIAALLALHTTVEAGAECALKASCACLIYRAVVRELNFLLLVAALSVVIDTAAHGNMSMTVLASL